MALSAANELHLRENRPTNAQIWDEALEIILEEHGTITTTTLTAKLKGRGRGTSEITADIAAIKGVIDELT